MALTERLALLVTLDANGAIKGFNDLGKAADRNLSKADQRLDRYASRFQKAGAGMLAGAGLAAAGLYKAGQAAADLEQAVGGTAAVFGDTSAKIDKFAKGAAQAMGLSEREFRTATTSIGGQLKGLGFSVDKAADQAVSLTKVAADLSATYGGTTAEAVAALGAAFRGEADPAERFNLFLNQTRVNAKAVELGLAATTSQVSANAKAQATLALITEQSADALGQFGREADTAAGAQARMKAELENAVAAIGLGVAPIIGDLASGVGGLASKFNELPGPIQANISKLATYGTIVTAALGGTSLLIGKVIEGRQRFKDFGDQLPRTSRALKGLGTAAAGLGGLIALDEILTPIGERFNDIIPDVEALENVLVRLAQQKNLEGLGVDLNAVGDALTRLTDPVQQFKDTIEGGGPLEDAFGFIDFGVKTDLEEATALVDQLDEALASIAVRDPTAAAGALNALAAELGLNVGDLVPLMDAYGGTLTAADTEQLLATESMGKLGGAAKTTAGHIGEVKTKFDALNESLMASIDADFAYEEAIDSTESALQRLAEATGLAIDKETTRAEKLEAIDDATRDAASAMRDQAQAAAEAAAQAYELAGASLTTAQKQQIFRDKLAELAGDLAPGSALRESIEGTISRLDALATDRRASLEIEIRESKLAILEGKDADAGQPRAIGGPVTAGQTYRVNENNPYGEFFTPSVNGTITPGGPMTSGAQSQVNHIVINNPTQEPASTSIRKVRSELAA